jgi:hypothetical protein
MIPAVQEVGSIHIFGDLPGELQSWSLVVFVEYSLLMVQTQQPCFLLLIFFCLILLPTIDTSPTPFFPEQVPQQSLSQLTGASDKPVPYPT